jgi:hypothetical protein
MDGIWQVLVPAMLGVVTAGITTTWRLRAERRVKKEEQLEALLSRYREPLANAAFDLQSRLYNIALMGFLPKYLGGHSHPEAVIRNTEYAIRSTQWLVAQFFGWTEILRSEVQFLDLGSLERNRRLVALQERVREAFATDRGV